MPTPERQVVEWIDASGARILWVVDTVDAGQTDAIVSAVSAVSNARVLYAARGPILTPGAAPANAQWPSVLDTAELAFGSTVGSLQDAKLWIPAPKSTIFFADGETVQASQVSGVTDACVDKLRNAAGLAVIGYLGGYRRGRAGRP